MPRSVTIPEAQAGLRSLIAQLGPGEELQIVEDARPMAKLVGAKVETETRRKPRLPGSAKGKLIVLQEDDDHLADFADHVVRRWAMYHANSVRNGGVKRSGSWAISDVSSSRVNHSP